MACSTFHKGKYYVTFKRGFEDNKRDITVSVDKVFESDTLVSFIILIPAISPAWNLCTQMFLQ